MPFGACSKNHGVVLGLGVGLGVMSIDESRFALLECTLPLCLGVTVLSTMLILKGRDVSSLSRVLTVVIFVKNS